MSEAKAAKKTAAKASAKKAPGQKTPAKKAAKKAAPAAEEAAQQKPAEARAVLRSIRISPRKLNLVAQSIRGLHVEDALAELAFSRKRIARDVHKCLWSAKANAEDAHQLNIDSLVVAHAYVGKNLVMKRMRARARGRGARVEKPFSQLTIIVREVEGARSKRQQRRGRKKAAKTAAREAA